MRAGRRTIPTAPRGCQSNRDGWRFKTSTRGVSKRVCPLRGDRTRGLAPFVGAGEAGLRAEPATVGGSIPFVGCITPREPPPGEFRRGYALFVGIVQGGWPPL